MWSIWTSDRVIVYLRLSTQFDGYQVSKDANTSGGKQTVIFYFLFRYNVVIIIRATYTYTYLNYTLNVRYT